MNEDLCDIIGSACIYISDHYTSSVKIPNKINTKSIVLTIIESRNKKIKQTTYLNFFRKNENLRIIKKEIKNKDIRFKVMQNNNYRESIDHLI